MLPASAKENVSAVIKMAVKKGVHSQLQIDVSNDEEWNKLLQNPGLTIVDIYSDWCGPCTAMVSRLRKLYFEIGTDNLHFAVANSNTITSLKKFQNRTEPTWIFLADGHIVKLLCGVDAPRLINEIKVYFETKL